MKLSTAGANGLISAGFKGTFDTGIIDLFSGAAPADPNSAHTGTLLARITKSGAAWVAGVATNGLVYDAALGVLSIHSGDTWSATVLATGTVGYAMAKGNAADDNAAHTTTISRAMLTVSAGGGGEVNLSHLDLVLAEPVSVTSIAITQTRGV